VGSSSILLPGVPSDSSKSYPERMADTRKILKVFLASPGDLKEERRAAKGAIDEINSLVANSFGYHVELVGWEDTVSRFGRPQAVINAELDHCEYFIGMLWK